MLLYNFRHAVCKIELNPPTIIMVPVTEHTRDVTTLQHLLKSLHSKSSHTTIIFVNELFGQIEVLTGLKPMNIGMSIASRTLNIENIIIQNTILKHKKGKQKISRKKIQKIKTMYKVQDIP